MILEWTKNIAVGVDVIDEQHKALFHVLNSLAEAIDRNSGANEIERVLGFLEGYVSEHFSTEEKMMKKVSCPGYKEHIDQHNIFIESFEEIRKVYRSEGATDELLLMLKSKLCNWLFSHIMMVDKRMGLFLNEPGALEE
ncbi:MAG: hemerythrin family protein [Thermodesulfobacteriota bacterium]